MLNKAGRGVSSLKSSPFSAAHLFIFAIIFGVIGIIVWKSLAAGSLGSALPARLPQSSGNGGTFFVDGSSGSDSNTGSSSSPWKTINKALNSVPLSGSIIRVRPGTYYSSPGNYVINFARAGNISDPITLRADQPGTVYIQNSDPTGWTIGAWIHGGATGLRIQDLTFKMLNNLGVGGSTDIQIEASDNVEFYNNTFNEVSGIGFICKGGYLTTGDTSDNIWVLNNSFRPSGTNAYAQVTGLGDTSNSYFGSKGSHWMYLGQFGSNPDPAKGEDWNHVNGCNKMVVANNTFVGAAAGRDIQLGPELRNSVIANNTFFGNKSVQTIGYGDPANDASAVYAGQGVVFFNNTGNTQYSTGNNVVTNNIFMNLYGHAASGSGSTMAGNIVQNNLSYGLDNGVYNGTAWDGDASLDYMYYYGTTANNLFSTGTGNQPKADPMFVNAMGFDYHLKSGSPATGKADPAYAYPTDRDGNQRSASPALGAYELGGTNTNPPPAVSLSANPSTISAGQASTLTWNSTNASSCTAGGAWTGTKSTTGSLSVSPTTTSTYSLSCTGTGGSTTASTTVTVSAAYTVSQSIVGGSTISGSISWTASPSSTSTSKVDYYIDNTLTWTENLSPYIYNGDGNALDTTTLSNGPHSFKVVATASDGTTASSAVTATVSNSTTKLGDLDGSGTVDVTDLSMLLTRFGTSDPVADIDKSGKVDVTDLSILLSHYGT